MLHLLFFLKVYMAEINHSREGLERFNFSSPPSIPPPFQADPPPWEVHVGRPDQAGKTRPRQGRPDKGGEDQDKGREDQTRQGRPDQAGKTRQDQTKAGKTRPGREDQTKAGKTRQRQGRPDKGRPGREDQNRQGRPDQAGKTRPGREASRQYNQ